jgi:hypothetical protein
MSVFSTTNEGKKADMLLLEWAEKNVYYQKGFAGKHYPPFVCHILNMFDKRVHDDCRWISPYGFMPEAGCAKHGD